MRTLHRRPGRAAAATLVALVLLAACAPTSSRPDASKPRPATARPGVARDAIRVRMAGFAGGPGFSLPDDLGGRPLVLNVWASWGGPCRTEMPAFQQVYLQAKDTVGFLGLDHLDVEAAARRFAAQTGVTYRLAADPKGEAGAKLGVASLPTTLFIAADGTLRGRHLGAMTATQLRGAIATYLGGAGAMTGVSRRHRPSRMRLERP